MTTKPYYPPGVTNLPYTFTVDDTVWSADQLGPFWYEESGIRTRYAEDLGLLVLPVAGPPGTMPEVVRVHGGVYTKHVAWLNSRQNQVPAMPGPNVSDGVSTLLGTATDVDLPAVDANGNSRLFSASGNYVYLMTAPTGAAAGTNLNPGTSPADIFTTCQNDYPAGSFNVNLTPQKCSTAPPVTGVTLG